MGIETAMALCAEQMRDAHTLLSQYQFQVGVLALGAGFAHGAEGNERNWNPVAVEVVYHGIGRQLGQNQVVGRCVAPFGRGVAWFRDHWFENMFTHS